MDLNKLFEEIKSAGVSEITINIKFNGKEIKVSSNEQTAPEQPEEKPAEETKPKTPDGDKVRQDKPNYYSEKEIAAMCCISTAQVNRLLHEAECPFVKLGRTKYYDIESLWAKRIEHEDDVLKNDGHRRGGTKFICGILYKHVK